MFASERRKAKTLNFSIAYGKTAFGLATDWGVSFGGGVDGGGVCDCYADDDVDGIGQVTKEQAQDILELWYRDRPEVRRWQERVKAEAMEGELSEVSVAMMCCSRIIAHCSSHSWQVYTLKGRTRSLLGIKDSRFSKAFGGASRMAVNTPIQGA